MAQLFDKSQGDELVSSMATAAQSVAADVDAGVDDEQLDSEVEPTIDVPDSTFWDSAESTGANADETSASTGSTDGDKLPGKAFVTYKENGREVSLTREQALQQLSLTGGARKAFSDLAKLRKEYDTVKTEIPELRKFKESWDKLEELKHDPEKLYEVVSGRAFAEFKKEIEESAKVYADANPAERHALDQEARVRGIERELDRERRLRKQELERAEGARESAERTSMQTALEREFFKHELAVDDPQIANRVSKMLWRNAIADIKEYHEQGYDVTPKVIAHAFKQNAGALQGFYGKSVDAAVAQRSAAKSETAKKSAQLASTSNYTVPNNNIPKGDPLTVFERMFRGRK